MNRHIHFILDRTGSMAIVKDATISGFNEYVDKLKRDDPDASFSLTLFDTEAIETFSAQPVLSVEHLNDKTYIPRANTPLWDAVGQVMSKSQDNPDTAYLVIVLTDGQENSSKEWDRVNLTTLIKEKEATGRWTFTYLGSNQDAWHEAAQFGAMPGAVQTYAASAAGTASAMSNVSAGTANWSANVKRGVTSSSSTFYAGIKCAECGEEMKAHETHQCPKALAKS